MSNNWISIESGKLPQKGERVFVCTGCFTCACCYINIHNEWKLAYDGSVFSGNITDWMPLPAPPSEEREISKDEWLLVEKIKFATSGMCHNDLAADKCSIEATEIAKGYFTEKISSLKNKYDRGEVGGIYNLAISDVLEILK